MIYPYFQNGSNQRWLATIVPCPDDAIPYYFYGPNMLTIRVFTNTESVNAYGDDILSDPHARRIIDTYDTFYRYKVYVILDQQADPMDGTFEELDGQLASICEALRPYGFEYLGIVDSNIVDTGAYLSDLINRYYSSLD